MEHNLQVVRLRHGPSWNQTYVVGVPGGPAMVIDPAWDVPSILAAAADHHLTIVQAVVTHGHYDHINGLAELVAATRATVTVHKSDAELMRHDFEETATLVSDGHRIPLGDVEATILHTPGHTQGSICIAVEGHLFTGDTLMVTGPGRAGPYVSARDDLARSIERRLARLDPAVIVHPGHDDGPEASAPLGEILLLRG